MNGRTRGFLALAILLAACGGVVGRPTAGGESHFLRRCFEGCGGLECVSDLCTRACIVGQSACSDLSPNARCTNLSVEPGSVAVCDLACSDDGGCASLGNGFACLRGFCRSTTPDASSGEGGANSSAGTAGASFTLGGQSGTAGGASAAPPDCSLQEPVTTLGEGAPTCAEREEVACSDQTPVGQDELSGQLAAIVEDCGFLPNESWVRVAFEGGCGKRLAASISGPSSPEKAALIACTIQALDRVRFACGDATNCAAYERSTLP
jgi:hypothetical protein